MTTYSPGQLHLPPPLDAPLKDIERLWLLTCCTYELFDEETMEDRYWDKFAANLQARKPEWSPYFSFCLSGPDHDVGATGSGVRWEHPLGVAKLVYLDCAKHYGRDPLGVLS